MAETETYTTLNQGSGGDKMDERQVTQPISQTVVKRPVVVLGDEVGTIFGDGNPMPMEDRAQRQMLERATLLSISKLDVNLSARHRERVRRGDRLDLIDIRGPGGR